MQKVVIIQSDKKQAPVRRAGIKIRGKAFGERRGSTIPSKGSSLERTSKVRNRASSMKKSASTESNSTGAGAFSKVSRGSSCETNTPSKAIKMRKGGGSTIKLNKKQIHLVKTSSYQQRSKSLSNHKGLKGELGKSIGRKFKVLKLSEEEGGG